MIDEGAIGSHQPTNPSWDPEARNPANDDRIWKLEKAQGKENIWGKISK